MTRPPARVPPLARVDQHLARWAGVAFAILAVDLRIPESLLAARARMLGLTARGRL